jgi:hypothetical protein
MSMKLAIEDLQQVLESSRHIDRVDNLPFRAGSRNCTMNIAMGAQESETNFGKTKTRQALTLTLTVKVAIAPEVMAELTKEIDKEIVTDRRRSTHAQTTILSEEGWEPEESEGKGAMSMSRNIEVHYYEDQV